jgi:hypothetical protein
MSVDGIRGRTRWYDPPIARGLRKRAALLVAIGVLVAAGSSASAISHPDTHLTPGAVDPAVTQVTIARTICKIGYGRSAGKVSTATRNRIYLAYHVKHADRSTFAIEHLVPLKLGGTNAIKNLWPEPKDEAKKNEVLHASLWASVCIFRSMGLARAQELLQSAWTTPPAPPIGSVPISPVAPEGEYLTLVHTFQQAADLGRAGDADLLDLGRRICADRRGGTDSFVEQTLLSTRDVLGISEIGYSGLLSSSSTALCPDVSP